MTTTPLALVRLMRLASPALPVGAYAYSQGMESAVDAGFVHDRLSAQRWIEGVLASGMTHTDLPVLARLHRAMLSSDYSAFHQWNARLLAMRESAELHFEDTQMGAALWRVLQKLDLLPPFALPAEGLSFAAGFALAGHRWDIDTDWLMTGYVWSWLENQVAAATKLVPLGQSDAQAIIEALHPQLIDRVADARDRGDDEIGLGMPGLAKLSATHEILYTRLFRS